ncbi:MAG: hypothetical protein MPK62_14970, partial [Alphaproteobacteria bacterium]|nr:hypothetical protein [Alphaproteobacteria bacterium]
MEKEFDAIYIVDLKGNLRKREKHNVFDIQTGVCVVFFIKYNKTKNIKNDPKSDIHYKAIDDLLSEKKIDDSKNHRLDFLDKYVLNQIHFDILNPKNGYWLDTEATDFDTLIPVVKKANKKADKTQNSIFSLHSNGVVTSRDHWVYDLDGETLKQKIKYFINTYNEDVKRWQASDKSTPIKDFVNRDIKHTSETENYIKKTKSIIFHKDHISDCMFRPFVKNKTYFGDIITHRKYQIPKLFGPNLSQKNICIVFVGNSERSVFKDNVFITDKIYDFGLFTEACKGIPLYTYPDAMDIACLLYTS